MTYLNFEGVFVVLGLIALYTLYFVLKIFLSNPGSIRNQQTTHQWFLIVGGMLVGMGIASQVRIPLSSKLSDPTNKGFASPELVFGLLLVLLGFIFAYIGNKYIQIALWTPIEQISEYSSEFGKSFLATRLPLLGGKELVRFSERFNENVTSVANKIATIQIYVDNLERATRSAIQASGSFGNYSDNIDNLVNNYQRLVEKQNYSLKMIDAQVKEFIEKYDDSQEKLNTEFTEIRALADVGNMLSVNASIEAINMDVVNPGIETVAAKLHDLATSLDGRQEELRKLLVEIRQTYEEFSHNVTNELGEVHSLIEDSTGLITNIQTTIDNLKVNEDNVKSSNGQLSSKLEDLMKNLPTSY